MDTDVILEKLSDRSIGKVEDVAPSHLKDSFKDLSFIGVEGCHTDILPIRVPQSSLQSVLSSRLLFGFLTVVHPRCYLSSGSRARPEIIQTDTPPLLCGG